MATTMATATSNPAATTKSHRGMAEPNGGAVSLLPSSIATLARAGAGTATLRFAGVVAGGADDAVATSQGVVCSGAGVTCDASPALPACESAASPCMLEPLAGSLIAACASSPSPVQLVAFVQKLGALGGACGTNCVCDASSSARNVPASRCRRKLDSERSGACAVVAGRACGAAADGPSSPHAAAWQVSALNIEEPEDECVFIHSQAVTLALTDAAGACAAAAS